MKLVAEIFVVLVLLCSCQTVITEKDFYRNYAKTEHAFDNCLQEHGNAFLLTSTFTFYSTIWYYENDSIYIQDRYRKKIINTRKYRCTKPLDFTKFNPNSEEAHEFGYVLDGDILKYGMNKKKFDYCLEVNYLKKKEPKDNFLNNLRMHIILYKLWF